MPMSMTWSFAKMRCWLRPSPRAMRRVPRISVSPSQGKLLHLLARAIEARNILELGTLGGYSTIWLARALPERGRLVTVEADPRHAVVAGKNIARAGLTWLVDLRVGRALDVLPRIAAEGSVRSTLSSSMRTRRAIPTISRGRSG